MTYTKERVYCRKCKTRHQIREWRCPFSGLQLVNDVWCPRRGVWMMPRRHENTGKWVPV